MNNSKLEGMTDAPADYTDPLVNAYKKDVDRTLLRENLRLTIPERCQKFLRNMAMVYELRRASRTRPPGP